MKRIESPKNERVKQWKKLLTKKGRDKTGLFLIEGFHLVEEAVKSGVHIEELIVAEHAVIPASWNISHIPMTIVTDEVIKAISDTETPQGIAAVCKQMHWNVDDIQTALFIDAVQDPGNVGTIIRTADAAGIDAVVVGEGSVDIYNAKVIRATQGSLFHFPVIKGDIGQWIAHFQNRHIPIYGTSLQNGVDYRSVSPSSSFALIVGNEGSGVNDKWLQQTTANLYVPIYGKAESLNVAVATGILLYHLQKK
ncbi:RNA 2'-O ribose methyltransferase, SpoU family [Anoxybacillus flavithermus TNO-09.006]|uniref:RNA methyltransferase n=1 Tax=Anoxybacillus flavithermus TaxID=33934 RepID=A0A178TN78_9BACL|nr:RNA methyltransferase [Anoxybacillus flavithermus]ASA97726.1 RNA methyltransferase [Anoxybacillus flavithermus]ELK22757.1 RNA 2'-O ribose methyltransferase, SpoU family [Anoxybacillus flavithermus TNO-09.006]MBE2904956.1 RNA methyltransferase [Anoxybacillus flavithermus]MBE2908156.1 RNA methyltransferase [Anoxybacillus flavithermus]MBE2911121.1 RNA methyltransferase [Anoxybacillus flavithermus]